jgi:predicted adenylyl cyclase CyaB
VSDRPADAPRPAGIVGPGRNVEIKARVEDPAGLRARAEAIADGPPEILEQEDVFFRGRAGRLKLRKMPGRDAELIHYERPDAEGPKGSDYVVAPCAEAAALETALTRSLGVDLVVRKTRRVYLVDRTRIHLDEVEGLGSFVELEVVLRPGEDEAAGEAVARELMERLGVGEGQLVRGAYRDLLAGG